MKYRFGFYRTKANLDNTVTRGVMTALHQLDYGFFPMELVVGPGKTRVLQTPADYDRRQLPPEYYIDSSSAAFSLACRNGAELVFTESSEPKLVPASLLVEFSGGVRADNAWNLEQLLCICRAVLGVFDADYAYLFDEAHAVRPQYLSQMFSFDRLKVPNGVYWINYYGSSWVQNIGRTQLERLRGLVPVFEWVKKQGLLFAIQEEPYDEANATHRANQENIENVLGLHQIQSKYRNPGL